MIAKTGLSGHARPDPQHQEWRHGEALNPAGRRTLAIRSPAALRFEPQCRISSLKFTQHFLGRWLIGSTRVDIENSSSSICRWTNRRLRGWAGGPRSCIGWLSTETCMFQVPTDQSLASPLPLPLRNPKSAPYRHTYRLPSLFVCVLDLMTRLLVFKWLLDHRLSTNSPMPPVFLPCAIFFSLVFDFPVYELLPTTF